MAEQVAKPTDVKPLEIPDENKPTAETPAIKAGIVSMADKFREAMSKKEDAPGAPPNPTPPPKPEAKAAAAPKPEAPTKPEEKAKSDNSENIRQLRELVGTTIKERDELKLKMASLEETSKKYQEAEARMKALDAERKEYEELVHRFYLENDPKFNAHYQERIGKVISKAKYLTDEHTEQVEEVFKMPPGKHRDVAWKELKKELGEDAPQIALLYAELKSTQEERDQELSKSKLENNWQKLQELKQKESEQEMERARTIRGQFWETVRPDIEKELEPLAAEKDFVENAKRKMRGLVDGTIGGEEITELIKNAAKGFRVSRTEEAKDKELAELREQVKKMTASAPGVHGGGRPAVQPSSKVDVVKSMSARYHEALGR